MKERPILFSAPMILAKLAGTKDVTRRLVSWKPIEPGLNLAFSGLDLGFYCSDLPSSGWVLRSRDGGGCWNDRTFPLHCPYGVAGDRLWIREAWRTVESLDLLSPSQLLETVPVRFEADGTERGKFRESVGRYRHARFMPRWASRMTDDVVSTRIERLHDITEDEARREGVDISKPWKMLVNGEPGEVHFFNHRDAFAHLWAAINGADSWKANPWVWRVETKRAGAIRLDEIKGALATGAEERRAAERTAKRSPRR